MMYGTPMSMRSLSGPRVSVIVPTYNRPTYHARLYSVFAAQTYPYRDLWIYDDSPQPSQFFSWLVDPRVHYFWGPERASIGAKRNYLIEQSGGEYIAHFDDDDFYARDYLAMMLSIIGSADLVKLAVWDSISAYDNSMWRWDTRATSETCYAVTGSGPATRLVDCTESRDAIEAALLGYGFSYVYPRATWAAGPFEDINLGEDLTFVRALGQRGGTVAFVDDHPDSVLHTLHAQSTSRIYPQTRISGPADDEMGVESVAPKGSWFGSWRVRLRAGRTYRVVALVKDSHTGDELLRRAAAYGQVLGLLDPATARGVSPAPAGYRYIDATIRVTTSCAIPRKVPPPFSALDKSALVQVTSVG